LQLSATRRPPRGYSHATVGGGICCSQWKAVCMCVWGGPEVTGEKTVPPLPGYVINTGQDGPEVLGLEHSSTRRATTTTFNQSRQDA